MLTNYKQVTFSQGNYSFILTNTIKGIIQIFTFVILFSILLLSLLDYDPIISILILFSLIIAYFIGIFLSRKGVQYSLTLDQANLEIKTDGFGTHTVKKFQIDTISEIKLEEVSDILKSFSKYFQLTASLDSGKIVIIDSTLLTNREVAEEIRLKILELVEKSQ